MSSARSGWLLGGLLAVALATAAYASAAGGPNIAAAPTVQVGQQQFGNTTEGTFPFNCAPDAASYWKLPLATGDRVVVDWETNGNAVERLFVLPPGTTDFSLSNLSHFYASFQIGGNHKAESVFNANTTGIYPLVFDKECVGGGGPYDFVVSVRHTVKLFLAPLKRIGRTGSVTVQVHDSDGNPVSDPGLQLTLVGAWPHTKAHPLASATPDQGSATFRLNLPRTLIGKSVRLRVGAAGDFYLSTSSTTRTVIVR